MSKLPKSVWVAVKGQLFESMPVPTTDYTGKTVMVTGSNSGLGLAVAQYFVKLNASRVIMACRDLEKAEKAKAQIEAATKRPGVAEVWHLDLSSFDNIKEFTQRAAKLDRLDIVVNNAAYLAYYFQKAPNGHEVITMINYIGTFYLTVLMVPILRQSSVKFNIEPRIIIVSSDAVFFTSFEQRHEDNILAALKTNAHHHDRYNVTKLLGLMAFRRLATAIDQSDKPHVTVNAIHPGFIATSLFRDVPWAARVFFAGLAAVFARSPEHAARTIMHGADAEDTHGKYYSHCVQWGWPAVMEGDEGEKLTDKVWEELKTLLEEVDPGVVSEI